MRSQVTRAEVAHGETCARCAIAGRSRDSRSEADRGSGYVVALNLEARIVAY